MGFLLQHGHAHVGPAGKSEIILWLAPIWMLAVGAVLGLVGLAVVYGILLLTWKKGASLAWETIHEGILSFLLLFVFTDGNKRFRFALFRSVPWKEYPKSIFLPLIRGLPLTLYLLTFFILICMPFVPYQSLITSLVRLPFAERIDYEAEVPAGAEEQVLAVAFRVPHPKDTKAQQSEEYFTSFSIKSSKNLSVKTNDPGKGFGAMTLHLGADKEVKFVRQKHPFQGDVTELYASNKGIEPARVSIHLVTGIEYPQSILIVQVAGVILGLSLLSFLMRMALPKLSAISRTTCKEAVSQPLFKVVMGLGAFALIAFIYIPYFTFGEDIKMLKTSGLTLIMLLSILLAMWTASVSVAEEIEGRTALTLLSKPISRRQFVLGKFFGLIGPIFLVVVSLGLLFMATSSYKVIYDARESVKVVDHWLECHQQMMLIVPGLALAFLEAVVMASVSVAISTRLPMIPNLIICSTVYVLGHLVPLLMQSSEGRFAIVHFMGELIATVFPVLQYFNIEGSIMKDRAVPLEYLGLALLYCILYSTIAMLFALFLFEDRDLA